MYTQLEHRRLLPITKIEGFVQEKKHIVAVKKRNRLDEKLKSLKFRLCRSKGSKLPYSCILYCNKL